MHLKTCKYEELKDFFLAYSMQNKNINQGIDLLKKELEHNVNQMNAFAQKVEEAIETLDMRISRRDSK